MSAAVHAFGGSRQSAHRSTQSHTIPHANTHTFRQRRTTNCISYIPRSKCMYLYAPPSGESGTRTTINKILATECNAAQKRIIIATCRETATEITSGVRQPVPPPPHTRAINNRVSSLMRGHIVYYPLLDCGDHNEINTYYTIIALVV